jgi:ketosteroid isomerase-like protein
MSQENVQLVLESGRRFVARDYSGLADTYTEDAVLVPPEGWPESGPFQGREAVMAQYVRLFEDSEGGSADAQRSASEGDWVVIEWVFQIRGPASHIAVATPISGAYRMEDGRIAEVRFFWKWPEALEVSGLRE